MKAKVVTEGVSQRGKDGVIRPVAVGATIDVSAEAFASLSTRGMLERAEGGRAQSKRGKLAGMLGIRRKKREV